MCLLWGWGHDTSRMFAKLTGTSQLSSKQRLWTGRLPDYRWSVACCQSCTTGFECESRAHKPAVQPQDTGHESSTAPTVPSRPDTLLRWAARLGIRFMSSSVDLDIASQEDVKLLPPVGVDVVIFHRWPKGSQGVRRLQNTACGVNALQDATAVTAESACRFQAKISRTWR